MLRIILLTILLFLVFILVRNFAASVARGRDRFARRPGPPAKTEDLVQDPCCRRYIPESEAFRATLEDKPLYFCSRECFEKYKAGDK